jgi:hypothetical protein
MRLGAAIATSLIVALGGPALANGCHHTKHVEVDVTFHDQLCVVTETSAIFTPGSYDAPEVEGTYQTVEGDTEPGDTITITFHAKQGVTIDGQKVFSWTYMPHPTAAECQPPAPGKAILKIRKFPSCNKSGRFVEITRAKGWAHLSKTHGPHRYRWVIKGRTANGYLFHGSDRVHKVIHLKHLKNCGTHSS